MQAHAVSELATELGEQGEVVRRKRDVEAVDLLTDRAEGLPERPERAGVELSAEITEEGRRHGGGHARVTDPSARAQRRTEVEPGGERLVRHPAMMPRVALERYRSVIAGSIRRRRNARTATTSVTRRIAPTTQGSKGVRP